MLLLLPSYFQHCHCRVQPSQEALLTINEAVQPFFGGEGLEDMLWLIQLQHHSTPLPPVMYFGIEYVTGLAVL